MSEVSSSGTVDEKELISVPRELYHHFESLKNQTNLTTVDLMRKLLGEYQTSPRESFLDEAETMLSQRGSPCPGSGMSQAGDERPLISPDVTTASRTLTPKPVGRKKTERPGSKLNKVCEILHCKRAARELEEQKRQEVSDRNCNSVESSSSGTICSLEETSLSHSDNGASGHENFREPTRRATNAQAPAAHTSPAKDAVNLRKLLGSRTMKLSFDRKQQDDLADVVLDLSVRQNRSAENVGAQSPYEEKLCHQGSLIVETALFRRQEYSSPSPSYAPAVTANGDGIGSPMYSHQFPVNNDSSGSYMMLPTVVESSQPDMAVGYPPADNLPPRQTTVTGSDYITKAPRIRPRRPAQRKAPVNEGMKLINENTLYPGVYTSTFKLPGSRRGRRAAAKQNMSQVKSTGGANATFPTSSVPTHSQSNVMIQMTNGTQPSMMLCPQVAVSSVLVKSPRKRGRPPKRPSISQFQTRVDACPNVTAPLIPRTTPMTIPGTGMISSENGAVSYLYNSQPQQPTVTIQATSMQQTNHISSNEPAQLHPNHNQLMNILNHATSINACNPVFVPHSSLQNGVATAIPTNASGMITLPLQQMNSGQPSVAQIIPTAQANVIPPSPVVNSELHSVSPQHASLVEMTSADRSPVPEKIEELSPMPVGGQPETGPTAGVFQEMILSPQSLINVKPRSKPTTTELIRSNSNFYCGSFKIRPQKPSTQTGQGTPVKRGRGRPRLNVFESNRQKETKESRSKMYQELFHCKVCNEIVSAVDRFCHQRKHVTVKLRCSTCGVEFQTFKGPDSLPVEFSSSHCPQCRKIFGYELGKSEESEDIEDLTDNKDAMEEEAETEKDLNTPNDIRARKLTCQLCGEICRSATEMAEHMLQHQDSPPTCMEDGCFQQFKNGSELRRHIRHIHGKGRGHTCAYDGCDKKFLKNCHLQEHIRVKHFNIKAFKCPWPDCSKEFAGIRHLKVHMLIHKDEKPLKCEYCDYRCRQRNALNWHMRKHPGVPFSSNEDPEGSDSDPDQQSAIDMSVFASQSDETDLKDYNPENSEADTCPPSDCDSCQANDSDVTEPGQMDV